MKAKVKKYYNLKHFVPVMLMFIISSAFVTAGLNRFTVDNFNIYIIIDTLKNVLYLYLFYKGASIHITESMVANFTLAKYNIMKSCVQFNEDSNNKYKIKYNEVEINNPTCFISVVEKKKEEYVTLFMRGFEIGQISIDRATTISKSIVNKFGHNTILEPNVMYRIYSIFNTTDFKIEVSNDGQDDYIETYISVKMNMFSDIKSILFHIIQRIPAILVATIYIINIYKLFSDPVILSNNISQLIVYILLGILSYSLFEYNMYNKYKKAIETLETIISKQKQYE